MKYRAVLKGSFEIVETCEANSKEEAQNIFENNGGNVIQADRANDEVEITELEEVNE